jgi:predicted DNA-binding antitoxin AbrB/MazE fold protein
MYTIKAIYNGSSFSPLQPIPIKEDYEVLITFVEPLKKDLLQSRKRPISELKGMLKGKVWMADDFDEPLEEMREYME